ncbi:hypothetical protein J2W21_001395 [Sinomonas atrocyanea]|uniref:DUF1214 domain-containing protein n=1 Tax=Sinomonas atrocyanea TaxID=37927 RepID=UPI002784D7D3|nr:DUF1214 domain-containing protein [Sinomonas atrocyanea]MDP9883901.1 hypothetical protein [Sinomonas atrocyanea]
MGRRWGYFAALVGAVCVAFIASMVFFRQERTVRSDVIQGFLIGYGLAFATAQAYARIRATRVNGWVTMAGLGRPGSGMLFRAAAAQLFPGPVNSPEEAVYWWATADGTGRPLDGRNAYTLHFPPGSLPPNNAFWSLTMGDGRNRLVPNPLSRYSLGDRSGLVPNADGSVDICLQQAAPEGGESNWLPAPPGRFILWLRVYEPAPAILDGTYRPPPVARTAGRP